MELLRKVVEIGGITGLYRGTIITFFREVPPMGLYFAVYERATELSIPYKKGPFTTLLSIMGCGMLCGAASWTSIYPLDIIKTKVQTTPFITDDERRVQGLKSFRVPTSAIIRETYRKGGIAAFYRGLGITIVRSCLFTSAFFPVYEGLKAFTK